MNLSCKALCLCQFASTKQGLSHLLTHTLWSREGPPGFWNVILGRAFLISSLTLP